MNFPLLNETSDNLNETTPKVIYYRKNYRYLSVEYQVIITCSYVFGIVGNLAALYILSAEKRGKFKNRKHVLMLRCLAANELVGLLGMLVQMHIQMYFYKDMSEKVFCVFRVLWRVFGLGSGCIAIVMAVERWLALTHPFTYQQHVTYQVIVKAIVIIWSSAFILVCMPFLGFGLYFESGKCLRYRLAKTAVDVTYAYTYFTYGTLLCIGISCANLSVTQSLCRITRQRRKKDLGRRICRTMSRTSSGLCYKTTVEYNEATPEEIAFARLMVALSLSFLVCWMPQMLSIPMAQSSLGTSEGFEIYYRTADFLMLLHFTFDPYIYVLFHACQPCLSTIFHILQKCCCCSCSGTNSDRDSIDHFDSLTEESLNGKNYKFKLRSKNFFNREKEEITSSSQC